MKNILIFCTLLFCTLACQKKECNRADKENHLIFGVSPGFGENCSTQFLLTSSQLFAQTENVCFPEDVCFFFQAAAEDKFHLAKPLLDSLPATLFTMNNATFKGPGNIDGGLYKLEIVQNGQTRLFFWSPDSNNIPAGIRPYFDQVAQVIFSF